MPAPNATLFLDRGFEGSISDTVPTQIFNGYNPSGTTIPYGRVVTKATAGDNAIQLPSATGQFVLGVTVFRGDREKDANGNAGVKANNAANVLRKGVVFMLTESNVTPTSPVFFRHTLNTVRGANEGLGRLRVDADTARADSLPRARFLETATAGSLVPVQFDL